MEENGNKHVRSKFWLGFSIGLMVALLFATIFFLVERKMDFPIELHVTTPPAPTEEKAPEEEVVKVNPAVGKQLSNTKTPKAALSDSLEILADDTLLAEGVFSFDPDEEGTDDFENIYQEKCLGRRTITVKSADKEIIPPIATFEVEAWSEPIKNKTSYQRKGNKLKVKGLNIESINIIYDDERYLMEVNGRRYPIPENATFGHLSPATP